MGLRANFLQCQGSVAAVDLSGGNAKRVTMGKLEAKLCLHELAARTQSVESRSRLNWETLRLFNTISATCWVSRPYHSSIASPTRLGIVARLKPFKVWRAGKLHTEDQLETLYIYIYIYMYTHASKVGGESCRDIGLASLARAMRSCVPVRRENCCGWSSPSVRSSVRLSVRQSVRQCAGFLQNQWKPLEPLELIGNKYK
jgi:hypothetical protein